MFEVSEEADMLWAEPEAGRGRSLGPRPLLRAALPRPKPCSRSRFRDLLSGRATDGATWESDGQ